MYHRYFIAKTGPFVERMQRFIEERRERIKQAQDLASEMGADYPAMTGRGIVGFVFTKNEPPAHLMAKKSGHTRDDKGNTLYRPDKRRKEGKELGKRMSAIRMPSNETAVSDVFECGNQWVMHAYAGKTALAMPVCGFLNGVALAKIPVAEKADGMNDDGRAEWQPPEIEGVEEVRESEFLAAQGK